VFVGLLVSNKEDIHAAWRMQGRSAQILQKSGHQHLILGVRWVTRSRFRDEDSQIPWATVWMYSPYSCIPGGGYFALGGKTRLHPRSSLILILHFTRLFLHTFCRRSGHISKLAFFFLQIPESTPWARSKYPSRGFSLHVSLHVVLPLQSFFKAYLTVFV
jgi:hypothetical protein